MHLKCFPSQRIGGDDDMLSQAFRRRVRYRERWLRCVRPRVLFVLGNRPVTAHVYTLPFLHFAWRMKNNYLLLRIPRIPLLTIFYVILFIPHAPDNSIPVFNRPKAQSQNATCLVCVDQSALWLDFFGDSSSASCNRV